MKIPFYVVLIFSLGNIASGYAQVDTTKNEVDTTAQVAQDLIYMIQKEINPDLLVPYHELKKALNKDYSLGQQATGISSYYQQVNQLAVPLDSLLKSGLIIKSSKPVLKLLRTRRYALKRQKIEDIPIFTSLDSLDLDYSNELKPNRVLGLTKEMETDFEFALERSIRPEVLWPSVTTMQKLDSLKDVMPRFRWFHLNRFGIDIYEVAYENWNAGGNNSIAILLNADIKRTYQYKNLRWQNELILKYGLNAQKGQKLRKTDDHFEFNSTIGYRTDSLSGWFYSAKTKFQTQFSNGYSYPNRDKSISTFMSPAYFYIGVGAEYGRDSDKFTLYLSPATEKSTIVMNQRLANEGAFGVQPAVYDANGNMIREGKNSNTEFGFLVTNEYHVELFDNIEFSNRLTLYSDYLKDFGNIDVNWQVDIKFRVNEFVAASIGSHLIYDNDVKTISTNAQGESFKRGAKVQWKQQLGIGVIVEI